MTSSRWARFSTQIATPLGLPLDGGGVGKIFFGIKIEASAESKSQRPSLASLAAGGGTRAAARSDPLISGLSLGQSDAAAWLVVRFDTTRRVPLFGRKKPSFFSFEGPRWSIGKGPPWTPMSQRPVPLPDQSSKTLDLDCKRATNFFLTDHHYGVVR